MISSSSQHVSRGSVLSTPHTTTLSTSTSTSTSTPISTHRPTLKRLDLQKLQQPPQHSLSRNASNADTITSPPTSSGSDSSSSTVYSPSHLTQTRTLMSIADENTHDDRWYPTSARNVLCSPHTPLSSSISRGSDSPYRLPPNACPSLGPTPTTSERARLDSKSQCDSPTMLVRSMSSFQGLHLGETRPEFFMMVPAKDPHCSMPIIPLLQDDEPLPELYYKDHSVCEDFDRYDGGGYNSSSASSSGCSSHICGSDEDEDDMMIWDSSRSNPGLRWVPNKNTRLDVDQGVLTATRPALATRTSNNHNNNNNHHSTFNPYKHPVLVTTTTTTTATTNSDSGISNSNNCSSHRKSVLSPDSTCSNDSLTCETTYATLASRLGALNDQRR